MNQYDKSVSSHASVNTQSARHVAVKVITNILLQQGSS